MMKKLIAALLIAVMVLTAAVALAEQYEGEDITFTYDENTFEITTEPMKGAVELTPEGYFIYTPKENKRGKDYFGFRAVDAAGNESQEGTVIIRLIRRSSRLTYADMKGSGAEYAAVALTEAGVFTGETVGGDRLFEPAGTVSRGEFLSMCMTAAGCPVIRGVVSTGFADDDSIGPWLKPYVATALLRGYIGGDELGGDFRPDEPIDLRNACMMLDAVLEITDVVSVASYIDMPEDPAAQAVANLTACHVMPLRGGELDAPLTRAGAAELLCGAMTMLENR